MDDGMNISNSIAIISFLGVFVILLLLIVLFISLGNKSIIPSIPLEPPTPLGPDSTPGRSSDGFYYSPENCSIYTTQATCEQSLARFWNSSLNKTGKCVCVNPFWGANGYRESYSDRYYGVGQVTYGITYTAGDTINVYRLSFPFVNERNLVQTTCSTMCNADSNCIGFIWKGITGPGLGITGPSGMCRLLTNNVTVLPGNNIPFDPYVDADLYLKNDQEPIFTDRVFLYRDALPLRYWLPGQRNVSVQTITTGTNFICSFFPLKIINNGDLTGVFSRSTIDVANINSIIAGGTTSTYYVLNPGDPLTLPSSWEGSTIYTVFVKYM